MVPVGVLMVVMCACGGVDGGHMYTGILKWLTSG